jgi:predicted amidohydrolase YtcJ
LRAHRYTDASSKGAFVVQNPIHCSSFFAELGGTRFSPTLLADVDPMKRLLDAGVKVAIGSDSVVAPGNPYLDLFFALIQPTHP